MQWRSRGFSLVEILLIIAIVAMIAVIAVPRVIDAMAQRELDKTVLQLADDLRWTMQKAANSPVSMTVKIVFINTPPFGYKVVQGIEETLVKPATSFPITVLFPKLQDEISFDVYGRPADGNDVRVTIVNTRGQSRTVSVNHLTGQVQVQ